MAEVDPAAAIDFLQYPEFKEFSLGIAEGVVAAFPEQIEEILTSVPKPGEQEKLILAVIDASGSRPQETFDPRAPGNASGIGSNELAGRIKRAIESSLLDKAQQEELMSRLPEEP